MSKDRRESNATMVKMYEDHFLRIPHSHLENSEILPEFVDFIQIWNLFP